MENTHPDADGIHDTGPAPGTVLLSDDHSHALQGGPEQAVPDRVRPDHADGASPDHADAASPDHAVPERAPDVPADDTPAADPSTARRSVDDIEHLLDEVEAALGRLDDGTYGRCSSCNSPITDERLAASPTAARCATCDPSGREG